MAEVNELRAGWAGWWIRRNPMYLASAACMAVGARLYLVSPATRAGDVGVILLTLGVLLGYEAAVTSILLVLDRYRRSPEDIPSLLLVAGLFWTGPLAATAEMTAHRPSLGLGLAAGVCVIALGEFAMVHRKLGWRFSAAGRAAAVTCVLFLAIAPPLLRVPDSNNGTNELFLYAGWWLLAAVSVAGISAVRHHARAPRVARGELWLETLMLVLVVGATALHLVGMNYAYFGHARWFYASPVAIILAAVLMEYASRAECVRSRSARQTIAWAGGLLPILAITVAREGFDPAVPAKLLPPGLSDPLLSTLVLAGVGWWFGFARLRDGRLLHAGSAAMGWAIVRGVRLYAHAPAALQAVPTGSEATRDMIVFGLYLLAAYLIVIATCRRCRLEAVAAIVVHQAAFSMMLWDRTPADVLLVSVSAGWSWLVCLHILGRPSLLANALPLVLLLLIAWGHDFTPELCWHARSHAAAMMLVLVVVALAWPAGRYGLMAVCSGVGNGVFYSGRWIGSRENAAAAFVVLAAFLMLGLGATVSWRKHTLLWVNPAEGGCS